MRKLAFWFVVLALLGACNFNSGKNLNSAKNIVPDKDNAGLKLPDGFSALIYADNIGHARHLAINTNGDVYVSLSNVKNGGGIVCLRDSNKDGRADIVKYHGIYDGTGIKIRNGFVYFGADTIIVRYKLTEGELVPSDTPEVIARSFTPQNQHATKPFTFDKDG
ncbi:MAG TPA: cytochrome C, partial [Prolixibacteraceae bacterium]